MKVADGFGWSPDSGDFEIRDNKAYWYDGDITDFDTQWCFRWVRMPSGTRYSLWTEAERQAVNTHWDQWRRQQTMAWWISQRLEWEDA